MDIIKTSRTLFTIIIGLLLLLCPLMVTANKMSAIKLHQGSATPEPTTQSALQSRPLIKLSRQEKIWLKAHPVIDIGVDGNWPPVDFLDTNGHHSGIAHEYLKYMAELLGVRFNPVPGPSFNEMLNKVMSGQLKVAMTIVQTPQRSQSLWFTEAYFTAHKIIVSRRSAKQFHSAEELSGNTVAMEEGYYSVDLIRKKYPDIKLKLFASTLEALNAVSWGQADAYIGNGVVVEWLIYEYQIANLDISGQAGLKPSKQRFAVYKSKSWQPLVGIINKALANINEKQQQAIYQKWVSFVSQADDIKIRAKLTKTEWQWLKQHSVIRLGIDKHWPPIEFVDHHGKYQGLSSDFIKIFSQAMDVNTSADTSLLWEQVIQQAKVHQLDLLPAVVKTPAREKYLNFTQAYLNFSTVIFVNERRRHTTTLFDLHGKTAGVERSYATEELVHRDHPEINLVRVKNNKEGLEQVALGKIDAYIGNLTTSSYLISKFGITNVKVGGTTPYAIDLRMGVRKDWPELVTILNKYLHALSAEDIASIRNKWLTVKYDIEVDYSTIRNMVIIAGLLLLLSFSWVIYFRQKNTALQRSKEQLNQIINTIPLAIVMTDDNGQIIRANSYAEDLLHIQGELVGQNLGRFYHDPLQRKTILQTLDQKARIKNFQVYLRTQNNEILKGLLSAIRIALGDKKVNLGIFVDLSDRIKMEEQLKRAKEASEQANRIKSNFLANMSHEIRTPMNAIIGMTHLVLMTELTQKQLDYIRKIDISAHHLLVIINDILDISKIEAGKLIIEKTTFNLDKVLQHINDLVAVKASEKNLSIIFKKAPDVPVNLLGDPLRLGQVLLNLVQNAIKFTEQGEVVISIDTLAHQAGQKDNIISIRFAVADSGIGIAADKLKNLFAPFVQADNSISRQYGGTGLGLSISSQLLALMGGQLSVQSQPGKGSTFSFTLEFEKQQTVSANSYAQQTSSSQELNKHYANNNIANNNITNNNIRRLKGKVLLVEDNKINQQVAKELLESFGLLVAIADNGEDALKLAQSTDFDLILMDIQMPVMDGLEATRQLRCTERYQYIPIIAMTAHAMDGDKATCLQAGMNDYLAKPIDPDELLELLGNWLESYDGLHTRNAKDLSDNIVLAEEIPGIDLAWGLKRVGANKKLFIRLLSDFYQTHHTACEKIRQLLVNNNIEAARRQVHTIQGVAGNIGARALQAAAKALEIAIRTGANESNYQELSENFCREAETVFNALSNMEQSSVSQNIKEYVKADTAHKSKPLTPEMRLQLEQLKTDLQNMLSEGDPDAQMVAQEILHKIHDYFNEKELALLRQIISSLRSYDFNAALELLQSLTPGLSQRGNKRERENKRMHTNQDEY